MQVQWIEDIQMLRELEPQWRELHDRCPDAAPFQHPSWLLPWWQHVGSGQLFTIAVHDVTRLTALLPVFLHEWNGRRQVTFLGNGASDRLDFLAVPELRNEAGFACLQALRSRADQWDLVHLECLPPDSPLAGGPREGNIISHRTLPTSDAALEATLPHGLRRNLRRYGERLRELGEVSFATLKQGPDFCGAFEQFLQLHRKRWRLAGEEGMIAGPLEQFHRAAAHQMARDGKTRCHLLQIDQQAIAAIYGFVDKQRFWSYQSGYDPAFASYSPGALILHYAMRRAIEEGCTVFDFLRGAEPYKRMWGAQLSTDRELVLCHTAA